MTNKQKSANSTSLFICMEVIKKNPKKYKKYMKTKLKIKYK